MASPKECKKTLVEIGDKKKSKADPDEGTDLEENGDEQDLEDRASEVSDSQRTTLVDLDFDEDTDDNGQDLEDEEADEGADVKERMD